MPVGAILGAVGGLAQMSSANKAAKAQGRQADRDAAFQTRVYDEGIARTKPFYDGGVAANSATMSRYGRHSVAAVARVIMVLPHLKSYPAYAGPLFWRDAGRIRANMGHLRLPMLVGASRARRHARSIGPMPAIQCRCPALCSKRTKKSESFSG